MIEYREAHFPFQDFQRQHRGLGTYAVEEGIKPGAADLTFQSASTVRNAHLPGLETLPGNNCSSQCAVCYVMRLHLQPPLRI